MTITSSTFKVRVHALGQFVLNNEYDELSSSNAYRYVKKKVDKNGKLVGFSPKAPFQLSKSNIIIGSGSYITSNVAERKYLLKDLAIIVDFKNSHPLIVAFGFSERQRNIWLIIKFTKQTDYNNFFSKLESLEENMNQLVETYERPQFQTFDSMMSEEFTNIEANGEETHTGEALPRVRINDIDSIKSSSRHSAKSSSKASSKHSAKSSSKSGVSAASAGTTSSSSSSSSSSSGSGDSDTIIQEESKQQKAGRRTRSHSGNSSGASSASGTSKTSSRASSKASVSSVASRELIDFSENTYHYEPKKGLVEDANGAVYLFCARYKVNNDRKAASSKKSSKTVSKKSSSSSSSSSSDSSSSTAKSSSSTSTAKGGENNEPYYSEIRAGGETGEGGGQVNGD